MSPIYSLTRPAITVGMMLLQRVHPEYNDRNVAVPINLLCMTLLGGRYGSQVRSMIYSLS